jgi:hypothetical protein
MSPSTPRSRSSACRRAIAILTAATAIGAVTAQPAAASFDAGETIGRFKVLGGHFRQQVQYLANYRLTGVASTQDDCYVFHFRDKGSANFDLSFVRGEVSRWRMTKIGFVDTGSENLGVSGETTRRFSQSETTQLGSGYDEDCDPPDPPSDSSPGCGKKNVKNAESGLSLLAVRQGSPAPDGGSAMLWGPVFNFGEDPIKNCSSTSVYASIALDAISRQAMKELDAMKVGDKLTLDRERTRTITTSEGFFWPFGTWAGGNQKVHIDWKLRLKRVPKQR